MSEIVQPTRDFCGFNTSNIFVTSILVARQAASGHLNLTCVINALQWKYADYNVLLTCATDYQPNRIDSSESHIEV